MIDVESIRDDFPALRRTHNGHRVVFADNASTSAKPRCVIDAVTFYYTDICANVHRGVNVLSEESDRLYEDARGEIAQLIGAWKDEIVYVRNTTEAINLACHLIGMTKDDQVVCGVTNHHSNLLPWYVHGDVVWAEQDEQGRLTTGLVLEQLTARTKLVALGHVSNVTGVINPVEDIVAEVRKRGILTLVDAAQSVAHMPIDIATIGADFVAFSGHKMFGPSGIGVLWARKDLLEAGQPLQYGGGMVARVDRTGFEAAESPFKFEAGTPNIEGAIGMGAAAHYLRDLDLIATREHSSALDLALIEELDRIDGLRYYPILRPTPSLPIVSFAVSGMNAQDVAAILCNRYGIMVRAGAHCAEPLLRDLGEQGLVRVSLCAYNTLDEVAYIGDSLRSIVSSLRGSSRRFSMFQ